ncbi:acyl carrier protein [Estrella lausannensis]|uniref:Acyl carrier protein n=1 Tax=Estrella lausannensis TaxID=483423 RepID=A0A0H5E6V3_9BACT|nr:acyl carrier protein [Estrella lausannensis]CRX39020.1 Acyl carrier protein [Estrella lausannensis]
MDKIDQDIIDTIAEILKVEKSEITPEKSFINDLGADSLDIPELIMALEDRIGVEITKEKARTIRTVGDALQVFKEYSKNK